ncbi:uncharacterized protein LOC120295463 [Eucalyptus grandis]|uniref:uncharacterized protein LOC120295463 n=1 Tax=Eucalyptus grandis TaxID=71139 RepID=UPI00192E960B|nr:uncharacterized protein LOC120295463 [Eucalyptus grandis]
MADWTTAFTIGLISHNQGNSSTHVIEVNGAFQAFWASFLLLHLGGPDTIAAFSLEDSSLWRRHLFSLIFQVSAAIYIFVQIFPSNKSLVIPTMLVFLAAVIKNVERILVLNLSSLPRFRVRVFSHHKHSKNSKIRLVEELNVLGDRYPEGEEAKLAESIVVKHARHFLNIFDIFLIDLIYSSEERMMSREYFRKVSAMDALRVISVELNFFYEMLYTKALTVHSKRSYIFRSIAFINVAITFILFNRLNKHQLPNLDMKITYSLLFGGIALDVIALLMLVFSDWTIAGIKWDNTTSSKLHSFLHKFVPNMDTLRKPQFATCKVEPNANVTYKVLNTPLIFQRWSESISACNLFSEYLDESPRKMPRQNRWWGIIPCSNVCGFPFRIAKKIIYYFVKVKDMIRREEMFMIANSENVSKNPFMKKLWIFIFKEVKRKSEKADNLTEVKNIVEARGAMFLNSILEGIDCGDLLGYVTEANYDSTILQWHVATEIWYNIEKVTERNDEREFSKILSDYMLYLLFNQPNVVSAVAGIAQITSLTMLISMQFNVPDVGARNVEELCSSCFAYDRHSFPGPGDLLHEGFKLAHKMESLKEMKWTVMSGVWVELLSYAASHIKGEAHVQVLRKGGELLTFVWLLMAHFGCFYRPELGMSYDPLRRFPEGY